MHVIVSAHLRQSYFLLHLPPKTRFPENGSLLLIGQFEGKECRTRVSSRQWGGSLRDDPNNGCEGDYGILGYFGQEIKFLKTEENLKTIVY